MCSCISRFLFALTNGLYFPRIDAKSIIFDTLQHFHFVVTCILLGFCHLSLFWATWVGQMHFLVNLARTAQLWTCPIYVTLRTVEGGVYPGVYGPYSLGQSCITTSRLHRWHIWVYSTIQCMHHGIGKLVPIWIMIIQSIWLLLYLTPQSIKVAEI